MIVYNDILKMLTTEILLQIYFINNLEYYCVKIHSSIHIQSQIEA